MPIAAHTTLIIMPTITDTAYIATTSTRLRLIFFVFFKSITIPSPALVQSPATQLPNVIPPFTNVSVITVDEAQLGISPTAAVING